jgi:hypothetical protein
VQIANASFDVAEVGFDLGESLLKGDLSPDQYYQERKTANDEKIQLERHWAIPNWPPARGT